VPPLKTTLFVRKYAKSKFQLTSVERHPAWYLLKPEILENVCIPQCWK